ncbi:MAG: asparagine synthase (glutamine-hydrolyzing) [Actinomycetota bacterium]|nr:asparagine synthase (glutamine-hydrolyzing) [Actinomycetota bacterium]
MCGIAGQARAGAEPVSEALLERMCAAIQHRGPDSRGTHHAPGVGLGIQRLRIIDLVTGDQPISNEDGTATVVLNGEIYNYRELRERLERAGHIFSTRTDTEVIVHLYEESGPDLVHDLHGMFAFALWDSRRRRLLLARDRVGKKPLFYALRERTLSFASELDALMKDPEISRDLDFHALDAFLALLYVPQPLSIYRAARKLPPGGRLVWEDGQARIDRWWRLSYRPKTGPTNIEELGDAVREAVRRATRRRLVSDVPLGAFLSGGIDSSAVVAAMAEASPEPVKTFSIGFTTSRAEFNELPYARLVAKTFGTDHHEEIVKPDAVAMLPRVVRAFGEPFADPTALPTFQLAEMTRRHVTVALTGDGGDESFAGYERYVANALLARFDGLPESARRAVARLGARIPPDPVINSTRSRLRRLAAGLPLSAADRYLAYSTRLDGVDRSRVYTPEGRARVGDGWLEGAFGDLWENAAADELVDHLLATDVELYLPGDLLAKADIATMHYSLEARSPLLDHELMEMVATVPPELKLRGREKKLGLRAALRGWVPDAILDRPKRGFELPIADWLRGDLGTYARDVLLDPRTRERGLLDAGYSRELLDRHMAGREDNARRIWTLLVLELWQRERVD